jgi:hypothetical protein
MKRPSIWTNIHQTEQYALALGRSRSQPCGLYRALLADRATLFAANGIVEWS